MKKIPLFATQLFSFLKKTHKKKIIDITPCRDGHDFDEEVGTREEADNTVTVKISSVCTQCNATRDFISYEVITPAKTHLKRVV